MGELPHFMSDIPEESLQQSEVKSEPSKIFTPLYYDSSGFGIDEVLYTVPSDSVYEITHIGLSAISGAANDTEFEVYAGSPGGAGTREYNLAKMLLDHAEHQCISYAWPKLSLFIQSNKSIRTRYSGGVGSKEFSVVIHGFLIKKSEIATKTTLII